MILSTITATDIAAWTGAITAIVGAIVAGIVKIMSAQAELEKQKQANETSQKVAALEAAHQGNQNAINNLSAAVTSHDAQLTTVALTTMPPAEIPKVQT